MDALPTHRDFAAHTGKGFIFDSYSERLVLASVTPHPRSAGPDAAHTPFTLLFHGPAGTVLPEGYHRATIQDGPAVAFYIMPIHTTARDRQDYQAVFN